MFFLRCNLFLVLSVLSLVACGSGDNTTTSQIDDVEMSSSETFVSSSLSEHSSSSKKSVLSSSSKVSSSYSVVIPSYSYPDWVNCVSDGRCGTFTDSRDDHVYKKVTIGTQTWMTENLAYLPSVNNKSEFSLTEARYYVYDYDGTIVAEAKAIKYFAAYGVLYNWQAAMTACPNGWHLPDTTEWNTLINYVGGDSTAATKLKSVSGWRTAGDVEKDSYGFSALPGGYCSTYDGSCFYVGDDGFWWTATPYDRSYASNLHMEYYEGAVRRIANEPDYGFSVRCILD